MLCRAIRPVADAFCMGLWQSAQPRLLLACVDPGQCRRVPPSWQVKHWAFCTSTGVPQRLVNPTSAVLSSAFLAPLTFGLRIQPEDLRMEGLAEVLVLLAVAFDAPRFADILGRLQGRLR
jgi:hypothetical protein